jgi:predicted NUDIX family phosphoesterase
MKNENVLVVAKDELERHFNLRQEFWSISEQDLNVLAAYYKSRQEAETDFNAKQLIPYALISDQEGRILTYNRHGSEQRLKGIFSVGIGGHVNDEDENCSIYKTLTTGLRREMNEEIGLRVSNADISLAGMINEDRSEVGHCHIGVVFKVELHDAMPSFSSEIENPQWLPLQDIDLSKFELWSALALKLISIK